MNYKVGRYIVGGGHYNPHTPPPSVNPGAIGVRPDNTHKSVDELLELHEGRIRVAKGLEKNVQILPPDPLELCYLGIQVINNFPDAYQRCLDVLEGYRNVRMIDEEVIKSITNLLEPEIDRKLIVGIAAMTESPDNVTKPQLQPQTRS